MNNDRLREAEELLREVLNFLTFGHALAGATDYGRRVLVPKIQNFLEEQPPQ